MKDQREDPYHERILRRPITARNTRWAIAISAWLVRIGLRPNQISLLSLACAALAGACLLLSGENASGMVRGAFLVGACVFIQLRLLCNLFDGMVAVEGRLKTKSGEIFNELPDRFSDVLIVLGAGWSLPGVRWAHELGWAAALLAVMTAYVRALGGTAGASQYFCGPMAKQQRMAVVTAGCLVEAVAASAQWRFHVMPYVLAAVAAGCVVTIFRRTVLIIKELELK